MDPPEHSLQAGQVFSMSAKKVDLLAFLSHGGQGDRYPIRVAVYAVRGNRAQAARWSLPLSCRRTAS